MVYRGLLSGSISYHGHSLDQLRSWLGLAITSHDFSGGLACAVELDLFSRCEGESIRTNMMNRLTALISETLLTQSDQLVQLGDQIRIWEATRRDDDPAASQESLVKLIHGVTQIYASPGLGTRIHELRTLYREGPRHNQLVSPEAIEFYGSFQPGIGWKCPEGDRWESPHERDPEEVGVLMNNFIYWFTQRDPRCLYPVYRLADLGSNKVRIHPRFRGWSPSTLSTTAACYPLGGRSRPEYVVWEYLLQDGIATPALETLFEWYIQRSGSWEVMTHAVMTTLLTDSSDVSPPPVLEDPLPLYHRNLKGEVNWDTIRMLKSAETSTSDTPLIRQIRQFQKKPVRKARRSKPLGTTDCGYVDLTDELTEDPHPV